MFRKYFEHTGILFCAKKTLLRKGLIDHFGELIESSISEAIFSTKGSQCGILFTNESKNFVEEKMQEFGSESFLQAGDISPCTVKISDEDLSHFPSSIQPYLEKIGVEVSVENGKVTLVNKDYTVCTKDEPITSQQSKILRCLRLKLSESKMQLVGSYSTENFNKI